MGAAVGVSASSASHATTNNIVDSAVIAMPTRGFVRRLKGFGFESTAGFRSR